MMRGGSLRGWRGGGASLLLLLLAPTAARAGVCRAPLGALPCTTACAPCCADLSAAACEACERDQCPQPEPPRCAERCNVCEACCHPYFGAAQDCAACAAAECDAPGAAVMAVGVLLPFLCRIVPLFVLRPLCARSSRCAAVRRAAYGSAADDELSSDSDSERAELGGDSSETDESPRDDDGGGGDGDSEGDAFTMLALCSDGSSWDAALAWRGHLHCTGTTLGALNCVLLHTLQPVAYLAVLSTYAGVLPSLQLALGAVVAARECSYLLATVACVWVNPAFLLVDIGASLAHDAEGRLWHGGHCLAVMWALAPEKFVAAALLDAGGLHRRDLFGFSWIFGGVCDLCAVAALAAGAVSGVLPLPLAVGLCATALGQLGFVAGLAAGNRAGREIAAVLAGLLLVAACAPLASRG